MLNIFLRFWWVLLPLALYFAYRFYQKRRTSPETPQEKAEIKLLLIAIAATGALLVVAIFSIYLRQESATGAYIPAHMKDGQLIPGRVEHK